MDSITEQSLELEVKKPTYIPYLIAIVIVGLSIGLFFLNKKQEVNKRYQAPTPKVVKKIGATLSLLPATQSASIGQEFIEEITINTNDQTISAAELFISYDPVKLQAIEVKEGVFLPVVLSPGIIKNGIINVTLGSQPSAPQKGIGVLATVKFKLLTSEAADITITDSTQIAAIGRTDNVLEKKTGAHISFFQMFKKGEL